MNLTPALRSTALAATFLLAGCGYSPLYAPGAGAATAADKVSIGTVELNNPQRNVGQRRVAQTVAQELKLNFPNSGANMDVVTINLKEDTDTLAVQRTAAVQRAQLNLTADIFLENANGDELLHTSVNTTAPYNVEDTPYSSESGKTYARLTAARNVADEISRRLYLYYSTHKNAGGTHPEPKPDAKSKK